MDRRCLVTCVVGTFLVGASSASATNGPADAAASATTEASVDANDAGCASLPAGVSAEWWAEVEGGRDLSHARRRGPV